MGRPEYTNNELRVLWYLKRHGPLVRRNNESLLRRVVSDLNDAIAIDTIRTILLHLEKRSLVLRTYKRGLQPFNSGQNNPMLKLELVDPEMWLPPCPPPIPLAVVVAHQNEELEERTAHEPTIEAIVGALIDRSIELQKQVDKLHDMVEGLNAENERLRKEARPKPAPHLTSRVRDVLTPEQWETLRHQ